MSSIGTQALLVLLLPLLLALPLVLGTYNATRSVAIFRHGTFVCVCIYVVHRDEDKYDYYDERPLPLTADPNYPKEDARTYFTKISNVRTDKFSLGKMLDGSKVKMLSVFSRRDAGSAYIE
jgi:hypothetical protein